MQKTIDYEIKSAKVTGLSILIIKGMRYSVPSRLSGHTLTLHIYQHKIDGYLGSARVLTLARKYQEQHKSYYVIDYHHLIHALIKKPGAFRYCKYRDEIFPSDAYRFIWNYIDATESRQTSAKTMLRILKLAADYDCEKSLALYLTELIHNKQKVDIGSIETRFNARRPLLPLIECKQHSLNHYDSLICATSIHINTTIGENNATS